MKKVIKAHKPKKYKILAYLLGSALYLTACATTVETTPTQESIGVEHTLESIEISSSNVVSVSVSEVESSEETMVVEEIEIPEDIASLTPIEVEVETLEEEVQERKLVALTFDDGPSKYTNELVEILNENGATATFFLIGKNISANKDAVINAYTSGNEIAIHTYTHTSFTKMTIEDVIAEIELTRTLIEELEVEPANLVRPPYGSMNDTIRDSIDTSFILWNVDTRDWESRDKDKIKEEVYAAIEEGNIILFHDVYPSTIEAVRELLPELSEEYEFVSVSELFARNNQTLEPNTKYYKLKKQD